MPRQGRRGGWGNEREDGWRGISCPGPSGPPCIGKASPGLEKAGCARVFSASSKALLGQGSGKGVVGFVGEAEEAEGRRPGDEVPWSRRAGAWNRVLQGTLFGVLQGASPRGIAEGIAWGSTCSIA